MAKKLCLNLNSNNYNIKYKIIRTYAKILYIAHDNFDELHYSFMGQRSFALAIA